MGLFNIDAAIWCPSIMSGFLWLTYLELGNASGELVTNTAILLAPTLKVSFPQWAFDLEQGFPKFWPYPYPNPSPIVQK